MSNPRPLATLGRSALIGALATVADLLALAILVHALAIPVALANIPALAFGVGIQFVGNKYFAFGDRSRAFVRQGSAFAAVEAGSFALNAAGFHLLAVTFGAHWLIARAVVSAAVYFGFSYPLWTRIFSPCPPAGR